MPVPVGMAGAAIMRDVVSVNTNVASMMIGWMGGGFVVG